MVLCVWYKIENFQIILFQKKIRNPNSDTAASNLISKSEISPLAWSAKQATLPVVRTSMAITQPASFSLSNVLGN